MGEVETDAAKLLGPSEFDEQWYLDQYPDVKMLGMNAAEHFMWIGKRMGRRGTQPLAVEARKDSTAPALAFLALPPSKRNYWIPQRLRDYLLETRREIAIPQVTTLMDLVVAYGAQDGVIERSTEFSYLLQWLQRRASAQTCDNPDVSIIVPVYNRLVFTLTAIASVFGNTSRFKYEILVADDCSNDGTAAAVSSIGGAVRHIRQQTNLGFLRNCNAAAEHARGKFVVMLNNDTITLPGWLDNLVAPLSARLEVGLVGSKLLNSDGSLQEAGGIYWNDGSAWNFGRDQDARAPEFNYVKEVDYCSGAAIALPTALWRKLGGFDTAFAPAYCEDSDLAFRVRDAGLKVLYHPHSDLIHHEGVSHGRDVKVGVKAHQVANSEKLAQRWKSVLARDHFPNGDDVFVARDRSRNKPHILIVDHYIPQWDKDAGSRSMFGCVRFFLDAGFHVTMWPDNLHWDEPYAIQLQGMGVEVIHGHHDFADWWTKNGRYFDFAFLSRAHIALRYIDKIRQATPSTTVLYYGHDLPWRRMLLEYEATREEKVRVEAETAKAAEDAISARADYIIYPAAEECEYARAQFKQAKGVIEMPVLMYEDEHLQGAELQVARVVERRFGMIFVGGFAHPPNADGIRWFLSEVFPLVRRIEPRATLTIVGSNMPADLRDARVPGVAAKGWLSDSDLDALVAEAACTIAPLRFGAGVKGKVINAFAAGSPVVSTSVGLQGVDRPGDAAFVADTAEAFAEAVLSCLNNRNLAAEKARNALSLVRRRYSRRAMALAFADVVPGQPARGALRT